MTGDTARRKVAGLRLDRFMRFVRLAGPIVALLVLAAYALLGAAPAYQMNASPPVGQDFASYYYAVQASRAGANPYDNEALTRRARAERGRHFVHPYLYPPAFLLGIAWALPLTLPEAASLLFVINQGMLLVLAWLFKKWFDVPLWILLALLLTFSPIVDNAMMGQVNLLVMALTVAGLAHKNGFWIGAAVASKMAPALFGLWWAARGMWVGIAAMVGTYVAGSALALVVVAPEHQIHFYRHVLPSLGSGEYNGLRVPIDLWANHSLADLFHRLWPSGDPHRLSGIAQIASLASSIAGAVALCWLLRRPDDELSEALAAGALTCWMLLVPVYCYEHHLVWMTLPLAALGTAIVRGRLGRLQTLATLVAYTLLFWPLMLRPSLSPHLPDLVIREAKFVGIVLVAVLCTAAARKPVSCDAPARVRSGWF